MPKLSAGVLLYRTDWTASLEVLLVHPGGPLWRNRDDGVWSIPKGEVEGEDDPQATAAREFAEELGCRAPTGPWTDLGEITQRAGKRVRAWAVAGDVDVAAVQSNTFELEWPPRSGRRESFPEIDRAAWLVLPVARRKLLQAQVPFLDRLTTALNGKEN